MNISINIGTNAPAPTNVINGFIKVESIFQPVDIDVTTLSQEDQLIVSNYIAIIGLHCCTNMINTQEQIELNMIVPNPVDLQALEFDYATLPVPDQANVVLFEALILENITVFPIEEI
jgi:hypothetical protein